MPKPDCTCGDCEPGNPTFCEPAREARGHPMNSNPNTPVAGLVERLRNPKKWCCIFEHEGQMRHGTTDAPYKAADRIEQLEADKRALVEAVVALADGADKCAEAPHHIVQPFLAIYRRHGETIAKARATISNPTSVKAEAPDNSA